TSSAVCIGGKIKTGIAMSQPTPDPTGGTVTQSGSYQINTFTANGTFIVPAGFNVPVEALVVAGGGGGGSDMGGGGGGGGGAYPGGGGGAAGAGAVNPATGGPGVPNSVLGTEYYWGGGGGGSGYSNVGGNGGIGGGGGGAIGVNTSTATSGGSGLNNG